MTQTQSSTTGSTTAETAREGSDMDADTVTVTLRIENTYELYDDVTTVVTVTVPAPPPEDSPDYLEWAGEYIHVTFGAGNYDGDSWYNAEVIESSDPALIGREFEDGY